MSVSLGKLQQKVSKRPIGKSSKPIRRKFGKTSALEGTTGRALIDIANRMTEDDKLLAQLSSQAYDHAKGNKDHNIAGYDLVDQLSGDEHVVYRHGGNNRVVIAYRGTDPTKAGDLVADAHIAAGTQAISGRFQRAMETYDKVRRFHKDHDIHLTGHSLGGALANWVSEQTGEHATTFNPGVGARDLRPAFLRKTKKGGKRRIVRVRSDPVSKLIEAQEGFFGEGRDVEVVNVDEQLGVLNSHSIDNFTA